MGAGPEAFITSAIYWALIIVWSVIIVFYAREYRRVRHIAPALTALLIVLFVDAGRTLFESLYFGTWYTARTNLIPRVLHELLAEPQYVIIPKALNLIAALVVVLVIVRRWLPGIEDTLSDYRRTQRLYEDLRRSESARDDLTRMIVHDMRTPLTSVLGGLQTVAAGGLSEDEERELLANARQDSEELLQMVNSLLDISRMESGEMELSLAEFPLGEVAQEAVDRAAGLAAAKSLQLSLDALAEPLTVLADRSAISRVLGNLLGNAIKFVPQGGEVRVSVASEDDGGAVVTVANNGPGIPPELHERIFDKFFRAEVADRAPAHSTGLGLAFCKLAVEAHGGRIWVTGDPGEGAQFHFSIPAPSPEGNAS
jgi:signal transduction histidine kinase